jgi:hypothetical protein
MMKLALTFLLVVAPLFPYWGNVDTPKYKVGLLLHDPAIIASGVGQSVATPDTDKMPAGVMVQIQDKGGNAADAYEVSLVYRGSDGKLYRRVQIFQHYNMQYNYVAVDIMYVGRGVTPVSVSVKPLVWKSVPVSEVP